MNKHSCEAQFTFPNMKLDDEAVKCKQECKIEF